MEPTNMDWTTALIAFLCDTLARWGNEWCHKCSTAYQIGCEALVALGQADQIDAGAIPREKPELPQVAPAMG